MKRIIHHDQVGLIPKMQHLKINYCNSPLSEDKGEKPHDHLNRGTKAFNKNSPKTRSKNHSIWQMASIKNVQQTSHRTVKY